MMRRLLFALLGTMLLMQGLAAQTPAQKFIASQVAKEPLKGAVWGILARRADGTVLAEYNAGTRMVPASNLKLVTTGTALHAFGAGYRFRTRLAYTGAIQADGTLDGDLYIVGGGDPTVGALDSIALNPDALFWKWKTLLRQAGIQRIHGRIVGDGTLWEGHLEHPSWPYDDLGTYYGCGGNALCFYKNAIDLDVSAGKEGDPVTVRQSYPDTPWMHFQNYAFTGPAGTGNSLYLYTTDLAPWSELRGTYSTERRPKTEHFANKFGALTCAYYFWKNLKDTGWEVTGGYADVDRNGLVRGPDFVPLDKAGSPREIGFTEGPALSEIARETNVRSDNFYAESLLRAMGEAATEIAVYDSCLVAENVVLQGLGVGLDGLVQADGSGLSRMNCLSPEWMVGFLEAMEESPSFGAFLASLPAPGQGTLRGIKFPGAERVRMKSGSMGGVLCYSGYILDQEGKPDIAFSFLTNHTTAPQSQVRTVMLRALSLLIP
jgi:D-alanyl-D-alanine carboxypeptidase/D-alanyl-D-alanine-endopeptidase (penicillin-binding protein 4)